MKKILAVFISAVFLCQSVFAVNVFESRGRVVVLMYHMLSENSKIWGDFCISPKVFENDIEYLKKNGYEFLTPSQLAAENTKNRKIAVITFDDGYLSDYQYALPILKKHSAKAAFFVIGSQIGKPGYMTADNIKEMAQSGYAEIGNHSYALHNLTASALTMLFRGGKSNAEIVKDYQKNAELLKKITGSDINSLSYPNGIFSDNVDKALRKSGVKTTFSTKPYSYAQINVSAPIGRKTRTSAAKLTNLMK